jgi:hypothetical protein
VLPRLGFRTLHGSNTDDVEQWWNESKEKGRFNHRQSHKKWRGNGMAGPLEGPAFDHGLQTSAWTQ